MLLREVVLSVPNDDALASLVFLMFGVFSSPSTQVYP